MSERIIAAEYLGCVTIVTAAHMADQGNTPDPREITAITAAYTALAGLALFGDNGAALGAGIGGLMVLALGLGGATKWLVDGIEKAIAPPQKNMLAAAMTGGSTGDSPPPSKLL